MNRPSLIYAVLLLGAAAAVAQQSSSSDQYQGQSRPPADDTIVATQADQAKPPAGKPLAAPPAAAPQPSATDPSVNTPQGDNGTVVVAPSYPASAPPQPTLSNRKYSDDPDGDIVHPNPLPPGTLGNGSVIRVRLTTRLSTARNQRGDEFRGEVASDVLEDGQVLIPAGSLLAGHIVEVSTGTFGGRGSLRLRPETITLPNGSSYHLDAQLTGMPGSRSKLGSEGTVNAGTRYKKAGIEYGGAVGAGVVTGAFLGGPVGALTGGLVGAGAITVHLMMDHPQATLEPGTVLLFTLNQRLSLTAASAQGN